MGAKDSWTENSVSVTGPPLNPSRKKRLHGIDVNLNKMPDVAMTLAVVALYADGPTAIRDVASWKVKETERTIAICTELRELGATVDEVSDYCIITPSEKLNVTAIDIYDDHKMAMSFSLAACADVPITIRDSGCTLKTFPDPLNCPNPPSCCFKAFTVLIADCFINQDGQTACGTCQANALSCSSCITNTYVGRM